MKKTVTFIHNINVGKVYDSPYGDCDVHFERFDKLADFFGHNMPVHWHDCFFQIHYLTHGQMHLQLDNRVYIMNAPFFVLTPPTVSHAFITGEDAQGYVLTISQTLVWPLLQQIFPRQAWSFQMPPCSVSVSAQESDVLQSMMHNMSQELTMPQLGQKQALHAWANVLLLHLLRIADKSSHVKDEKVPRGDIRLFQQFNQLVQTHAFEHLSLKSYASKMHVTQARLNDICHGISNLTPKQIIIEFLLKEARSLLRYSPLSVQEMAYQLGFKDPSYFSRFFSRAMQMSPSDFRLQHCQAKTL